MSEYVIPAGATMYELTWGGSGANKRVPTQCRLFRLEHLADAAVRFSERVLELDGNDGIGAAWVHLKQCNPGEEPVWKLSWTKCSNERPTVEGLTVELSAA